MKLIVAVDCNWGIGKDNKLLAHLPGDLKYFKEKTTGKVVIMGRKTLESLPGGKPLPNRTNIVITANPLFKKEGCTVVHNVEQLLSVCGKHVDDDLIVMGGASVYDLLLEFCDTCYVTKMNKAFGADRFVSNLDENDEFEQVWESEPQFENDIEYKFTEYKRVK